MEVQIYFINKISKKNDFFDQSVSSLYIWYTYIYGEFLTKNYMSTNFVMELPIQEGNEHLFSCSVL